MNKKRVVRGITVQTRNTLALPERAQTTARCLDNINALFSNLFADENFLTLLQAESIIMMPAYLRPVFDEAKSRNEVT
jgi:hypothetical protein